jgi:hypothetical protein
MSDGPFEEAVAAWTAHFEADLDAAKALMDQVGRSGNLPDRAKQLGLSVALTPREYRCKHYDDARYCPYCVLDKGPEADLERERELQAELKEKNEYLRREQEELRRQSEAIEFQAAEIERLRRELEGVQARISRRGAKRRRPPWRA